MRHIGIDVLTTWQVGQVSRPARGVHTLPGRTWRSGADVDVCPTNNNVVALEVSNAD